MENLGLRRVWYVQATFVSCRSERAQARCCPYFDLTLPGTVVMNAGLGFFQREKLYTFQKRNQQDCIYIRVSSCCFAFSIDSWSQLYGRLWQAAICIQEYKQISALWNVSLGLKKHFDVWVPNEEILIQLVCDWGSVFNIQR